MTKHIGKAAAILIALALAVTLAPASPASANQIAEGSGNSSYHAKRYEKPCKMKYKKKPKLRKQCNGAGHIRSHASKARRVTRDMMREYGDLKPMTSGDMTLREAMNTKQRGTFAPRWRTFSQNGIAVPGVNTLYDERHEGMAFFNGEDVWIASNHGVEDSGYHRCGIETQFPGFSVNNTDCSENSKKMPGTGTEYIQFWDYFEIAAVCKWCFPTHYNMHVNIHESGHISFWFYDDRRGSEG